jgi:hypothetical protein
VFARVCFSTKSNLENLLDDLDRLHDENKSIMRAADKSFFEGILHDGKRRTVLIDDFRDELYWEVMRVPGYLGSGYYSTLKNSTLRAEKDAPTVFIGISTENDLDLDKLNTPTVQEAAKRALKKVYRLEAECIFEEDIPF